MDPWCESAKWVRLPSTAHCPVTPTVSESAVYRLQVGSTPIWGAAPAWPWWSRHPSEERDISVRSRGPACWGHGSMGEHSHGMREVAGSTPADSTEARVARRSSTGSTYPRARSDSGRAHEGLVVQWEDAAFATPKRRFDPGRVQEGSVVQREDIAPARRERQFESGQIHEAPVAQWQSTRLVSGRRGVRSSPGAIRGARRIPGLALRRRAAQFNSAAPHHLLPSPVDSGGSATNRASFGFDS